MPKKISPEKTKKYESESSEGEEEGDSGSETGSEHEQFQINQSIQSLPNSAVKKVEIEPSSSIAAQTDSSSSGSESESESERAEAAVVPLPAKRGHDLQKSGGKRTHGEPETTMSKKKKLELSTKGEKKIVNDDTKKQLFEPSSSIAAQSDSSSSGEEDESGSESESESERAEAAVVPLPAKRGHDLQKSGAAGGKRTHGEPETTMSKKKKLELSTKGEKKIVNDDTKKIVNDDTKKQLFQRIWSEDDEIVVLKGMVDYAEKKKSDPVLDLDAFHGFIKDNLHFDVSRNQLQEKIRRLKKKYLNHKTKELEGTDKKFSKPHEQQAYELSKEVWGKKNVDSAVGIPKPRSSVAKKRQIKTQAENGKSEDIINMVKLVNGDSDTVVRKLEFASVDTDSIFPLSSKNTDMESLIRSTGTKLYEVDGIVQGTKEWRQLVLEEIELYDKKLTLMSARAKLVIRGLKSRNQ